MRSLPSLLLLSVLGACAPDAVTFIEGTATLPDCHDTPVTNLDGTRWYDNGTIGIADAGCPGTTVGETLTVCGLDWDFSQVGNDVEVVVDTEYRIKGRLCAEKLYLKGGWWLPVQDSDTGGCTYEDDSAEEVAIQAGGNVLTVTAQEMSGTLAVKGRCSGSYSATFRRK
jgi:Ser-tRNA(Ala) deacylase AlaX